MGVKIRWFRGRPSDEEMREELEAHVAMRAEHDHVDEAAARRRLGNMLHTRESMRRVWIAEWWDALRQDAHFTWRSWWRRPAFALAAILVLGLGLGASTALFAALALLLAAAGHYSVASNLVLQRRPDNGVRIAIGATPREVALRVVGEAGRWIVGGAVAGSALGWMGSRALQSQLYQVEALDPWSWTGALLALALVLVTAVFRPAYRAAHVDPVAALRSE